MSALEACNLYVGASFFLRWDPFDNSAPLIQVYINRVDICADRNPRRLLVFVTREHPSPEGDNVLRLTIHQKDSHSEPYMSYTGSGEQVTWSLPPENALHFPVNQRKEHAIPSQFPLDRRLVHGEGISSSFSRPLRFLSQDIQKGLERFPSISKKDMTVHGNYVRQDVRASADCTLHEWEELVQTIVDDKKTNVRHEPAYEVRNVPRYDESEMSVHFPSVQCLLALFRHLTAFNLRRLILKIKKARKRRRNDEDDSVHPSGPQSIQLLGDYVSQRDEMTFTIGTLYQPGLALPESATYPVLHRSSNKWNNLERVFQCPLTLNWMTPEELRLKHEREQAKDSEGKNGKKPRSGRKRISESFLGFKWIRTAEENGRSSTFYNFDANDINGVLHFCAPSVVFTGNLMVPDILRLYESSPSIFDPKF